MKDIGKKIRQLREAQGMTQEELAHKVGYKSRVSINKIELQRDVPLKKLVPIADALGIPPAELAGWSEDDPAPAPAPSYNLTLTEQQLIDAYRNGDAVTRNMIERILAFNNINDL